jgi:hypothetical protein
MATKTERLFPVPGAILARVFLSFLFKKETENPGKLKQIAKFKVS